MIGVSRLGLLGEDFLKLFKFKQLPVFSILVASTSVQKLATCYELVKQEVVVPLGANQQLLHGDVLASLPGFGGCEAALAVQVVVAVQPALVCEELSCVRMLRDVGSMVV